jgi:hypothetical protein
VPGSQGSGFASTLGYLMSRRWRFENGVIVPGSQGSGFASTLGYLMSRRWRFGNMSLRWRLEHVGPLALRNHATPSTLGTCRAVGAWKTPVAATTGQSAFHTSMTFATTFSFLFWLGKTLTLI